jgi:hypothetical protein
MSSVSRWVVAGLTVAVAGWTLAASADANDRRVRDRREDVRDRREDVRDRADGTTGPRDRAEDVRDRREDLRDRLNAPRTPEQREKGRENTVDKRQDNQAKRIEHGINKGYLTADEIKKLQAQQASIAAMEESFKGDGKLTRSEFKQLQSALNDASRCIWAEKHDTDGNQMPVYRLGKNVRVNNDVAQKLADDNLSKADARAFAKDFHLMLGIKHRLSTADLTAEQRAKLQAEYNELLNKYFYLVE